MVLCENKHTFSFQNFARSIGGTQNTTIESYDKDQTVSVSLILMHIGKWADVGTNFLFSPTVSRLQVRWVWWETGPHCLSPSPRRSCGARPSTCSWSVRASSQRSSSPPPGTRSTPGSRAGTEFWVGAQLHHENWGVGDACFQRLLLTSTHCTRFSCWVVFCLSVIFGTWLFSSCTALEFRSLSLVTSTIHCVHGQCKLLCESVLLRRAVQGISTPGVAAVL